MMNFAQIPILGRSFSVEYQSILDRAQTLGYTLPNSSIQVAQNAYLEKMKSSGYWYTLDLFYLFRTGDSGLSDFATINWITPASYQLTKVNSPSFDGEGYTGNSTSSYLDTSYNPTTNAVYYGTVGTVFCYITTAGSPQDNTNPLWGQTGNGNVSGFGANSTSQRQSSANMAVAQSLTDAGYRAINRPDTTQTDLYKDTTKTNQARTSIAHSSLTISIARWNAQYGNAETSMFGLGGSQAEATHNLIRQDYLDYVSSL